MGPSFWIWGAIALSCAILIAGFINGRNLSEKRKTTHTRKFAAVALVPLILAFSFPPPYVYHRSGTESLEYIKLTDSSSVDGLSRDSNEQAKYINQLKEEVEQLRMDLSEVSEYYRRLTQFLVTGMLVFCIVYPLKRNQEDGHGVEEKSARFE